MTKKRMSEPWMPAGEYGRAMPRFTVNLLVRDLGRSVPFYRDVLGATVRYSDSDFAALNLAVLDFMLHADHTYDHHPLYERLKNDAPRGTGAELRLLGIDPDVTCSNAHRIRLLGAGRSSMSRARSTCIATSSTSSFRKK